MQRTDICVELYFHSSSIFTYANTLNLIHLKNTPECKRIFSQAHYGHHIKPCLWLCLKHPKTISWKQFSISVSKTSAQNIWSSGWPFTAATKAWLCIEQLLLTKGCLELWDLFETSKLSILGFILCGNKNAFTHLKI